MNVFAICCAASLYLIVVSGACGSDADAGRRLAQLRCAACHIVAQNPRDEVADAPPFAIIGRKFGFNYDSLVFALMGPHAKMNFGLTRPEANDVAAYITAPRAAMAKRIITSGPQTSAMA
jgi:mono/diheme cytochrome c family protein